MQGRWLENTQGRVYSRWIGSRTHECVCITGCNWRAMLDLQNTAAEEPWELSGWELVLDCALSELLSKLFPDNMHTQNETKHTCMQREMTISCSYCTQKHNRSVTVRTDGRSSMKWRCWGRWMLKVINPVNLFSLWEITATFHWFFSVTRCHRKKKRHFPHYPS